MSFRQNVSSGGKWEPIVGYSRAVRVGNFIAVAGTTAALPDGSVSGDAYRQTIAVIEKIKAALEETGAGLEDVVRTRIFVANMDDWEAIGHAHGEFFREILPVSTMVEVSRFIGSGMLVEIEADAIIP